MNIDSKIVKAYISGANMCEYKNEWLFSGSVIDADRGKNIFVFPPDDNSMRSSVSETEQCFYRVIENFKPVNLRIWDALFPNWQEKQAVIDLIVGFPEPYDAVTAKSQDGQTHLIFDLICWNKYRSMANFDEIIRNVLTHELTHFLIGCYYPEADTALESTDYLTKLDAYTFHEGFAHLISYNSTEIGNVDWHIAKLDEVYSSCKEKMRRALAETDSKKQEQFLCDSICGKYFEKFTSICGMLYLANQWELKGLDGLKTAFSDCHEFAEKTLIQAF